MSNSKTDRRNPKEAARIRDEALGRALNTPPTPHKKVGSKQVRGGTTKKKTRKTGQAS